jgi:capsule biosynthesis phosphatase
MIVIIPLGGTGERFKKNNYKEPKALIKVFGQPILFYLLNNIDTKKVDKIIIPYNKEYSNYNFEGLLKNKYPLIKFSFLKLQENTRGAAETLNLALKNENIYEDKPILCLDGDNFYNIDIIDIWGGKDGIITFEDVNTDPIYSYVEINENNRITNIKEKTKISNYACSGGYGFSSWKTLLKYTTHVLENNIRDKDEFYTSVVIKEMIKDNITFENIHINKKNWICLGTPIQLRQFYHNFPRNTFNNKQLIKNKRICFDLDNTLVTYPKVNGDYTTVEPITKNINYLKYLKGFGNTIIIYTARRMRTHNGNVGKINADIGKITFDTLDKFNVPYDEIYFGKPYADVYIDDLALNCFDDMEKSLGYYMDHIDTRSFNELNENTIETFTKKSEDLSGEIYYYKHIPREIKDLFGLFIDYDNDNKWYKMEKINGLTATTLYLSELMTTDNLLNIMTSINRIQSVEISNFNYIDNLNIYENYANKLKKRYMNYNYTKFDNADGIYEDLYNKLLEYESNKKGKISVIHGDTVLTNILINTFDKIKFIDMRGRLGDKLSICGDWLYDWAKLYQSLIGYDKILMGKSISSGYENKMIHFFENRFANMYSQEDLNNLKLITKSLLFSLIPLHDNNNCVQYFNLIKQITI